MNNIRGVLAVHPFPVVTSLGALKSAISTAIQRLGFRFFIYRGRFPNLPTGANDILMDSCPADWHEYCLRHKLSDPWDLVHRRALRQVLPVCWREMAPNYPDLFAKARPFGMLTGVTQPLHGPSGQWSALSFVKDRSGQGTERAIVAVLPQCQFLAAAVHNAVARIARKRLDATVTSRRPAPNATEDLSERQRECMFLAARGNTISEISNLMAISARTVAFHLSNGRRKLGVVNLRQAVIKATSLGLIAA